MKQFIQLIVFSLLCFSALQVHAQDLHRKNGDLPCLNKNFNLVVHIAVDSLNRDPIVAEAFVNKMLIETSEYFSPICVSFTACEIQIIENNYSYANLQDSPISVEERVEKMEVLFSKERRINLFIVDSIQNVDCGIGQFEGITTRDDANMVIELFNCPDLKDSQNLAHQIGHLFGLYDTFNDNADLELVDGSNCQTAGDFICDTPADPYGKMIPVPSEPGVFLVGNYESNCEFIFNGQDENGEYWQPDMGNIMSAYPCKCGFTRQQYFKMVEVYNNSEFKNY